jgi:hypothetical protein
MLNVEVVLRNRYDKLIDRYVMKFWDLKLQFSCVVKKRNHLQVTTLAHAGKVKNVSLFLHNVKQRVLFNRLSKPTVGHNVWFFK